MLKITKIKNIFVISLLLIFISFVPIFAEDEELKGPLLLPQDQNLKSKCPEGMIHIPTGMVPSKKNEEQEGTELITLEEFCIDEYEYPNKKGEFPSTKISWFEAEVYCKKLEKRLCSGEEWEKACSGKSWYKYSYGDSFKSEVCGVIVKPRKDVNKSGIYPDCVSEYGVYDMIGNVWEWTNDPVYGTNIKRGGYVNANSTEANCFYRKPQPPKTAGIHDGFRCCKNVQIY